MRLIAFLLLAALAGHGLCDPLVLDAGMARQPLAGHVEMLRDRSGAMAIADAVAAAEAGYFQAVPGSIASGFMPGAVWLRFTLERQTAAPAQWWLAADGYLEGLDLYRPRADGGFERIAGGIELPAAERGIAYRNPVFVLDLPAGQAQTFFARLPVDGARRARLAVWLPESFQAEAVRDALRQGAYFGMVALVVAVNLALFAWQRRAVYGLYAAYVLSLALFFFIYKGHFQLFFEPPPGLGIAVARLAVSAWLAAQAALLSRLLELGRHLPRIDRAYRAFCYGVAGASAMAVLAGVFAPLAAAANLARVLAASLGLALPLLLLRRGVAQAGTYLLAFGLLLAAVLLVTVEQHGLFQVAWDFSTDALLQAATLPHVVVMHLIVARHFRKMQAARQRAECELALERHRGDDQGQFLSLLAHEIRGPLTVIDGTAQLLAMAGRAEACQVAAIRTGVARIAALLGNCLTGERIAGHGWQLDIGAVDLAAVARAAAAAHSSSRHAIHCRLDALPERFPCDGGLLRIVLDNLLDNAVKYSPGGGRIEVRGRLQPDGGVCLEVEDEGVGIDPGEADKIFDRYYRTRQVAEVAGAGLGLHLVRRIAELHGGGAVCRSRPGRGTCIAVNLPAARSG